MNLKHGDIITLDNGDTVKVSLEVISEKITEKITELIPGHRYLLKYTGQFCHAYGEKGIIDYPNKDDFFRSRFFTYIGKWENCRNIFYCSSKGYCMFSANNLNYVIREVN